ncbi:MAG TPA: (Na+)-NQR maturation NqrM [Gammaproteobacteria bacterium]|nr:(Na+)-NQR maturation NqrM [Gammaproteobacteria bacterium]
MLFLVVFAVMLLVVLGMSSGVLAGRRPIAGSCGGIANLGIEKECSICGGVREKCDEVNTQQGSLAHNAAQSYDATKR